MPAKRLRRLAVRQAIVEEQDFGSRAAGCLFECLKSAGIGCGCVDFEGRQADLHRGDGGEAVAFDQLMPVRRVGVREAACNDSARV